MVSFLGESFRIQNVDYVPYEGQLLVLFKAIGMGEATKEEVDDIRRWFWAAGFNESLRGKPDHYVVRAVDDWRSLIAGGIRGLEPRLRLGPDDFSSRRLIKGKALSTAFIAMFAGRGAKSLVTGVEIPAPLCMSVPDTRSFTPILSNEELRLSGVEAGQSPRLFANLLLQNPIDEPLPNSRSILERLESLVRSSQDDVLESQFLDREAAQFLLHGNVPEFLQRRSSLLHSAAEALTAR